jgi:D-alanyl-lipoteichoic acid acyltransferase DltB (MBOAT superfamily)
MNLTTLSFAGFTILVLILYYLLPRRPQNILLLIASYTFYFTWSWFYALLLLLITVINFLLSPHLRRENKPNRPVLWFGVGFNVLMLAVFKLEAFFIHDLYEKLDNLGIGTGIGGLKLLVPIGMSFYIVTAISYLYDVARGQAQPVADPVDFGLYLAYFPKLLAGPIERARNFMPQLAAQRIVDNEAITRSLALIVLGVIRKIVLADTMFRMFPADLWEYPEHYSGPKLIIYLIVYGLALYNDFAGYVDVARGVSGLFGIKLSQNFNQPYFASSFSDFWNRWHITLSNWLRDYIFYPTSRALLRRYKRPTSIPNIVIPPMLTLLISGFWHGSGWTFILWGALHGAYLVGERLIMLFVRPKLSGKKMVWSQGLSRIIVITLVFLAWVPFRTGTLEQTLHYWQGLLRWNNVDLPPLYILIVIVPALWLDWIQYKTQDELVFLRWPQPVRAALLALALLLTFMVTQATTSPPFVYQGF